jgi:tight adherence protein B
MLPIIAAVLVFVMIGSVGWVLVSGDSGGSTQAIKRAKALRVASLEKEQKRRSAPVNTPEARRKQLLLQLREMDRADRKARTTLTSKLRQANVSMSARSFIIISSIIGVVSGLITLLLSGKILLAIGVAVVLGFGAPRWVLGMKGKKRLKQFSLAFPDAIDVLVRGIKSGLPIHDGFKIIARESPQPLGSEFQILVEGLGVGLTLAEALDKMYERMPTPELKFFAIVIAIQQKSGGNLAEALTNLSTVLRARRMMGEKIKAMSSEAIASAGIIGSLPPAVVTLMLLVSPDYMGLLFTDVRGHFILLGAGLWMGMGVFVMKRMIAFKF